MSVLIIYFQYAGLSDLDVLFQIYGRYSGKEFKFKAGMSKSPSLLTPLF